MFTIIILILGELELAPPAVNVDELEFAAPAINIDRGFRSLFRTKSIQELISTSEAHPGRLSRSLGLWSLVALGIGSVIGSGIFTFTGTAAAGTKVDVPSILKAPVLDMILHGGPVASVGRPGAGPAISLIRGNRPSRYS